MSSTYWMARSGIAIVGHTPPRVRHALASTVTSASYLGWRSKRRVTQQNMAMVLGLPIADPRVRRAALASWSTYGRTASSLVTLPYLDLAGIDERIEDHTEAMSWREAIHRGQAAGRGLILATAHFGCWDLAGAVAARHVPLSALVDTFKDPALNRLLQGHRQERHVEIIPAQGGARRALRELHDGRALAIVVDRPVSPGQGVPVTFFGRRTFVPGGAAALAVQTGAAIMPGYVWYAPGGGYYLRAFAPIVPRPVAGRDEKAAEIARLMQYVLDCQEVVVRAAPTQWFMFRPFWPDAPEVAATPGLAADLVAA